MLQAKLDAYFEETILFCKLCESGVRLKEKKKKDETLFPNYTSITADTVRHKTRNRSGWIGINDVGQRFILTFDASHVME